MKPKLKNRLAILGALAVLGFAGCANPASTPEQSGTSDDQVVGEKVELGHGGEEVVIGLTYVPNVQFAPVYVAGADEVFRAAGIGASIRHHGPDEGLFTALASGEEDITVASGDEVLQARAAGLDLVAIGSYYNRYPVSVISKQESGISSITDLKGKRVGLPGEYGSNWFGLLAALDSAGMTTQDITVVSIGYTQAASLAANAVDAVVGFVNSDAVQIEQMGIPVNVIDLAAEQVPLVGATIVTTSQWLEQHPDLAKSTVAAITAGMERTAKNPQRAIEITAKWDRSLSQAEARETAILMLEATIPLWINAEGIASTQQDLQTWERMAPFLADVLGIDEAEMGESQAVTNDYASPSD